jgi:hypothetical protein
MGDNDKIRFIKVVYEDEDFVELAWNWVDIGLL